MIRTNSQKKDLRANSLNISLPDLDNPSNSQHQPEKKALTMRKKISHHKSLTSSQLLQQTKSLPLSHLQGNRISSNLKEALTEQSFNKLKAFNAEQQIDILMSTTAEVSKRGTSSYSLTRSRSQATQKLSGQNIPNLKMSNIIGKQQPKRALSFRKDNSTQSFVREEKLQADSSYTEEIELKRYKTFMNRASYDPKILASENKSSREQMALSNSNKIEAFNASLLTSEGPMPKEGSLLKYFRDGITKSKSTQIFKQMVRAKSGLGFKDRKSTRDLSPIPHDTNKSSSINIFTNMALTNLAEKEEVESQQGSETKESRPKTTAVVLRKTSEGIILSKPLESSEHESEYIQSFVHKVKSYIKQKTEHLETDEHSPVRIVVKKNRDHTSTRRSVGLDTTNASLLNTNSEEKAASISCPKIESRELIKKKLFQTNSMPVRSGSNHSLFRETPDPWLNHREGNAEDEEDLDILEIPSSGSGSDSEDEVAVVRLQKEIAEKKIRPSNSKKPRTIESYQETKKQNVIDDKYLDYVKTRSQEIEEYIVSNAININRAYDQYDYAMDVSRIIERRGGIVPKAIKKNRRNSKEFISERNELKEIYEEISKLEVTRNEDKILHEKRYATREVALEKALLIRPGYLTQSELTFVRTFFQNKNLDDVSKLDTMLSRLRFFNLLPKEARIELYKQAHYFKQEAGSYIYREGEIGDSMFVVLKGSVNIKSQRILDDGQVHVITVGSLGDGSHFGDVAEVNKEKKTEGDEDDAKRRQVFATKVKSLADVRARNREFDELEMKKEQEARPNETSKSNLRDKFNLLENKIEPQVPKANTPTKRTSSIQCAEPCEVLVLEKDKYQTILSEILNKDITNKLNLINLIPFFKGVEKQSLIPVTTNLRKIKLKLGQRVIREGDIVMNFYIMAKGKCTVVKEIIDDRRVGRDHYKPKLRGLHFKNFEKKNNINESNNPTEQLQQSKKDENVDTVALDRQINEIVEKVAGDNVQDQEVLREKLKPFKFESLIAILNNLKKGSNKFNKNPRTYNGEPVENPKEKDQNKPGYLATRHVLFRELTIGDTFGYRPIYRREVDSAYKQLPESRARLTVIANTEDVELYVLTRDSLDYLPENVKNLLVDNVERMVDFDDFDINQGIEEYKQWRQFRVGLAKEIFTKPDPGLEYIIDTYKAY